MMKEKLDLMDEHNAIRDDVTLSDVFKILWNKILILILCLVLGALAGGAFGVWQTWNVDYYGTSMEFYVNPVEATADEDATVKINGTYGTQIMDTLIGLLESDSFAEILLYEDVLPYDQFVADSAKTDVNAARDAYQAYTSKLEELGVVHADTVAAFTAFELAQETALNTWRQTDLYKSMVSKVLSATAFEYPSTRTSDSKTAQSFIIVDIKTLNDQAFAEYLHRQIDKFLPSYVIDRMPQVSQDSREFTPFCEKISRLDDVKLLNAGAMQSTAIKLAVLFGAAATLIACVVVVVIDYSDKRLRDFERVMAKFNVPVLGVIPTIRETEHNETDNGGHAA